MYELNDSLEFLTKEKVIYKPSKKCENDLQMHENICIQCNKCGFFLRDYSSKTLFKKSDFEEAKNRLKKLIETGEKPLKINKTIKLKPKKRGGVSLLIIMQTTEDGICRMYTKFSDASEFKSYEEITEKMFESYKKRYTEVNE